MASDTLVIKHFPIQLTDLEREKYLTDCGAVNVRVIWSKSNRRSICFARFLTPAHATHALRNLHQQELMGCYLSVEYALGKKGVATYEDTPPVQVQSRNESSSEVMFKKFLEKLNSWAAGNDLRAPVPSHLRYHYPPPTPTTLRNITHLISTNPRLYTQVLHLMNKMNLPCPIGKELFDLAPIPIPPKAQPTIPTEQTLTSSEDESELSTDSGGAQEKETIPELLLRKKKQIKRLKLIKPLQQSKTSTNVRKKTFDEVFEDPKKILEQPKKRKLPPLSEFVKDMTPTHEINIKSGEDGFGFLNPIGKPVELSEEKVEVDVRNPMEEERLEKQVFDCISAVALAANRISEKDRALLPVFKNYAEGAATCRIYIKNLAKHTTEEDLNFIYSRYRKSSEPDSPNTFDIRLMKEGRMKGQAFVTLQSVELAKSALAETNGYILNDKPMVVQFARSATK